MNTRGLEVSFAWIFAMIAGSVILFLAIYATIHTVNVGQATTNTEVAAQLNALLTPVETTIESGKTALVQFNGQTRLINRCRDEGIFGTQELTTRVKSSVGDTWSSEGVPVRTHNKYLFSQKEEEGKILYLFIKPFFKPYKVADVIIGTTRSYCFIAPPLRVQDELALLDLSFVRTVTQATQCKQNELTVCFSSNCAIRVDLSRGSVTIDRKTVYFGKDTTLLYAAIFSDPEIYECQVKRLFKRTSELADIYASKAELLQGSACSSNLATDLRAYGSFIRSTQGSGSIVSIEAESERLEKANEALICKLF